MIIQITENNEESLRQSSTDVKVLSQSGKAPLGTVGQRQP
jgi:hypothetical protein